MTGARPDRYLVPGLVRGLRVLELFDRAHPEWNLSELAAAAGLPRSTTYRLVVTLAHLGYLESARSRKTYRLSARVLNLGFEYLGSQELVEIAHAPLERLGARTGGSTHLGVLDGTDVVYLLRIAGPSRLVSNVRVGTRLPAHATVMGRALLASHSTEALRARFGDEIHITGGMSNVSFGLPARKLLNEMFVLLAVEAGADGGIMDPVASPPEAILAIDRTDPNYKLAEDVLMGRDEHCMAYIRAWRKSRRKARG